MTLLAHLAVVRGSLDLRVELDARRGETIAILGPNGAGKSTLLRCLAGLERIDSGRLELDGTVLDDPAARIFIEPRHRHIGVVFQDDLLFPTLTVLENVAFGLRSRGATKSDARTRAASMLERLNLSTLAAARPAALSGGQSQQVALARALVTEPSLMLLDEPLAALDVTTKVEIRRAVREQLQAVDGTRILVTHDPVDAFALAERVVILEDGLISQSGVLADVAAQPRTRYVADLIGVNLFEGRATDQSVELTDGRRIVSASATTGEVFVLVHPRSVALHRSRPEGSPRNVWEGTVVDVDLERDRARVRVDGPIALTAEITAIAATQLAARPGEQIWLSVKATEVETYPR